MIYKFTQNNYSLYNMLNNAILKNISFSNTLPLHDENTLRDLLRSYLYYPNILPLHVCLWHM